MKAKQVKLYNDFHNSEATIKPHEDGIITTSQMTRARRKLCGLSSCECGGIRGRQEVNIEPLSEREGYGPDAYRIAGIRDAAGNWQKWE